MFENEDNLLHPILACGHTWDDTEPWEDMAVIVKETLNGPDRPLPAYSTGHICRSCRANLPGERLRSVTEADG